MVRMQIREDPDDDQPTSRRTSLAWDRTRQPKRGILKHRKTTNGIFSVSKPMRDDSLLVSSQDIQDILGSMSLNETMSSQLHQSNTDESIEVKASKLYGIPYEPCHHYNVSTSLTIRYALSEHRITKIRNHESLISFMDIYDLPALLKEVIGQYPLIFHETGSNSNNDFYCNAYWAVRLTDSIAELVFEKLGLTNDSVITYNPSVDLRTNVRSITETTHILKHQVSVCDWLTTTIGPNYTNTCIPYQLGSLLLKELLKLLDILTCANDMWINYAVNTLC